MTLTARLTGTVFLSLILLTTSLFAQYLPKERAGQIGQPTGKIAFIRSKNIWTMNVDNTQQQKVCDITNADGRLSWSADGNRIAFTRSGTVETMGPDLLGGHHKVYDIFHVIMDSVRANNFQYWVRPTLDMGSRDPEWSRDGKTVIYWKDVNANYVNAAEPNYQLYMMDPDGNEIKPLRKDWQNPGVMFKSPSMNPAGDIVFIAFSLAEQRDLGMAILPAGKYGLSSDSIIAQARANSGWIAPAWSPDGKWIAVVAAKMDDASLYIVTPNLKEKFLVFKPPLGTTLTTFAPSWSPDGTWLTFSTSDGSIWICDITGQNAKRLTGPGPDFGPAWSKK